MEWLLLLSVLVCTVLARRHHHYHYHVDTTPHVTAPLSTTSPASVVSERDRRHGDAITNVLYTKHQPGLVYQTAYRDVVKMKTTHHTTYVCCSGWTQITKISHGCNKPSCSEVCHNGGTCVKPNLCTCPKGFKGKQCELDVNECKEQKPCDHICHNTEGSFFCQCRENFTLQPDAQSCKKEGEEGPAFEAKDLEFELLNKRIVDLEKMMGNEVFHDVNDTFILNELKKRVDTLTSNLTQLENRMDGVEESQREISTIKEKLNSLERKRIKVAYN